LRRYVTAFVGSYILWLLLVGGFDGAEVIAGGIVALVATLVSAPYLSLLDGLRLRLLLPWYALRYLASFLLALVRANLDMARRVLSPRLPIRPGIVEVRTELRSRLGRLLLANSITLTPGTLTVDVVDDRLVVHWVDIAPGSDIERATDAIASDFERHLKEFME
jgi:multicomponent Na+:H+ antiporter subunit E